MLKTTKVDISIDRRSVSVRLMPHIWTAFQGLAQADKTTVGALAKTAQREHNGTLAEAITAYVEKHAKVYLHNTCQDWLGSVTEAMRPVFAKRGYPLPAKIKAIMGFPSKGWKGKAIGEHWSPESSSDGETHTIFIKPTESDPIKIINILCHELCHAADEVRNGKAVTKAQAHGKHFRTIGAAMDLEGKAAHMLGRLEGAWGLWAIPLLDEVGPMPHNKLADYIKAQPKEKTRMLKLECDDSECGAIWRMALTKIQDKPKLSCPCCARKIVNEHYDGGEDDQDHDLEDDGGLDAPEQETAHRPRRQPVPRPKARLPRQPETTAKGGYRLPSAQPEGLSRHDMAVREAFAEDRPLKRREGR